jgi:hypothetical protein
MDRRRSRRWPRQLDARLWKAGEEQPVAASIVNISVTGLFVRTPNVAPPGTRFRVEIIHSTGGFLIETVVARAIKTPPALQAAQPSGMGLRFLTPEALLEELLPSAMLSQPGGGAPTAGEPVSIAATRPPGPSPEPSSPPPAPRPDAAEGAPRQITPEDRLFRISYRSREQFRKVFESDIQTGGLFVPAARPPELDEVVEVEVSIDGAVHLAVRVEGRVVHRMEAQHGREGEGNLLAGMGLQFTDVPRAVERLRELLGH